MKTINIEIPEGKRAEWVNGVLTLVDEQPKDITERIKTFEDAYKWCLENDYNHLVRVWEDFNDREESVEDIEAYLKLRIITCALNEGWEPTFNSCESRWRLRYNIYQNNLDCVEATWSASFVWNTSATTLYFKSKELALYAAKQFKDIYMDFCYKGKE